MTTLVRIHRKGQMTLPSRLRIAIGVAEGDLIEASLQRGKIVLTPKVVVDRSRFPSADDEYTPAQRKIVDARLKQSEEDLKKGRTFGPFKTADEMIASMKDQLKTRGAAGTKTAKRSR
jgi:AbrB family looped-hinge helix DNA binding protein